jgi:hypothetical protein
MTQGIPKSRSRKVNGYVTAVLALEAIRKKRDARYARWVCAVDQKRDRLAAEVETRRRKLSGGQYAAARWILNAIPAIDRSNDLVRYEVPGRKARILAPRAPRPSLVGDASGAATVAAERGP